MFSYARERVRQVRLQDLDIQSRCTDKVRNDLVSRAEGIILWFKLAFDEVMSKCLQGSSEQQLRAIVENLPPNLDVLYQRMLESIPSVHKNEAALTLFLVQKVSELAQQQLPRHGPKNDFDYFWGAWNFLAQQHGNSLNIRQFSDFDALKLRVKELLRGLLETHPITWVSEEGHEDARKPHDDFCSESGLEIRYIHKSFYSYLEKSRWVVRHLPSHILQEYSKLFWVRVFAGVLVAASADNIIPGHIKEGCFKEFQHLLYVCRLIDGGDLRRRGMAQVLAYLVRTRQSCLLAVMKEFLPSFSNPWSQYADWQSGFEQKLIGRFWAPVYKRFIGFVTPQLELPSSWQSKRRFLRTSFLLLFPVARHDERRGYSSYPIIKPFLGKETSIFMLVASTDSFFSAGMRSIQDELLQHADIDTLSEIAGLIWVMQEDLQGLFDKTIAERVLSDRQKLLLRKIVAVDKRDQESLSYYSARLQ